MHKVFVENVSFLCCYATAVVVNISSFHCARLVYTMMFRDIAKQK